MSEEKLVNEFELNEEKEPVTDIKKYLIFSSNNKLFGVDTGYVETILTETTITYVPMLPGHIRGVINMRGLIVPIIDFRLLLGQGMSDSQCVVVLKRTTPMWAFWWTMLMRWKMLVARIYCRCRSRAIRRCIIW